MEETLGKRIVQNRKRLGLTQDQLAERLGVTAQAVSKWENDQSCPDITMLPMLAEIFGTTTDALLGHQTERVHEAQVVDGQEPEGLHIEKDGVEFRYEGGRKAGLGAAALLLLVGGLMLAKELLGLEVTFWQLLWPSALVVFGAFGLWPRFSFFRLGCMLAGLYFLADYLLPDIPQLNSGVLIAACLLLAGLSLLADALRKRKESRWTVTRNGKQAKPSRSFHTEGEHLDYSASFGEGRELVTMPRLSSGEIHTSFGEYTVDLSGVEELGENCRLETHCSFGAQHILVPRRFRVAPESSTAFADISVEGAPEDGAEGMLLLEAHCSFGQIIVRYI